MHLKASPWQQKRGSHAEPRGDGHHVGHHNVGDEHQHQGEGHDPLERGQVCFNSPTLRKCHCQHWPQDERHINALPNSLVKSCSGKTQNENRSLTVIPQKAAVFFPNRCRNHCHSGMLITAETWVNKCKQSFRDACMKRVL